MAATVATLLPQAKAILNIPNATATWDSQLTDHMTQAVQMLWPLAQAELPPDTTQVWPSADPILQLPAGMRGIRRMEAKDTAGTYQPVSSSHWVLHGETNVYALLDTLEFKGKLLRLWGLGNYVLHASNAALTTLPLELEIVVLYWTVAIFYESFAGQKRRYDSYIGTSGAAADHDIKDSAQYFHDRGKELLEERAPLRGA